MFFGHETLLLVGAKSTLKAALDMGQTVEKFLPRGPQQTDPQPVFAGGTA